MTHFRFLLRDVVHNIGRRPLVVEFIGHESHGTVDMREECFVALTKIIESGFPIRCGDGAVFRAPAVADEAYITIETILR